MTPDESFDLACAELIKLGATRESIDAAVDIELTRIMLEGYDEANGIEGGPLWVARQRVLMATVEAIEQHLSAKGYIVGVDTVEDEDGFPQRIIVTPDLTDEQP